MSAPPQEDAQLATLEELFEFIDCCVCPDVFTDCIGPVDPWCEHALLLPIEFPTDETATTPTTIDESPRSSENSTPPKPKRRRKRTGWSSSTGLQRRKRAELQFLREHVRGLEAYAENLKKRVGMTMVTEEGACNWQAMAAVEFAERQKAEETNGVLRKILDNQLQVSTALQRIAEQTALV
ncbi:hypothetical protein PHYPSEUDO_010697 [Phytophthora pseudosyringae]|uniref:Uncharacterized protein n=1 Tax=Phytophthora pseudosyringae TaxID=221518 RepID=A0A8T1VCP8_9STRA|nr:hypothetical protein PHYPSEUDO_010697 [Phytophthora pseudosyringae]